MFLRCKANQTINKISIQEIYNLIPVQKLLKLADKDTLFIFDVDDVLITPSDEDNFKHPYRNQLWELIANKLTLEKREILESSVVYVTKQVLVESRIINIFDYLKLQQIPTMALTAFGTGKFGVITKKEDFRIKELDSVGISFLSLTPLRGELLAIELENTNMIYSDLICKGIPTLKSGIILTAGVDKSVVLEYMFSHYQYYPDTIIFVDDCMRNIVSLKNLCIKLKINFYGLCYRAVYLMPLPVINEHLEKLRFDVLEQECVWLGYSELLKKKYLNHSSYNFL